MPLDEISYGIFIIQYFEQDDPDFYITKIKYIEENNVDDMELVFAEEEYTNGQLTKVKFSSSHFILENYISLINAFIECLEIILTAMKGDGICRKTKKEVIR